MRSARLGGTGSLGHRRAPGACRPVGNGWVGHIAIAGRRPRSGASRRRASLSRPCTSQQGWPRSVVWVSSQRKLAEHRAAVPQLRQGSLAGGSACAVEAPPSSQTASHAAPAQGRAGPQRVPRQTDRHCYLERRLRLSRASAAQNRAVRIIREVAGTHRSSHRTIRPRAPLRSGAPRTTSRPPRPRSRAASVATMRRRQRHPSAAVPAPPAPRASPGPARPRR